MEIDKSIYDAEEPNSDFSRGDDVNSHIEAIESLILVNEIEKEDLSQPYRLNQPKSESETSIYETATPKITDQSFASSVEYTPDKDVSVELNFTYSASEKKLCFIGNDADSIPSEIINQFGLKTIVLDISFNYISDLKDLEQFPYIEELICDNNFISENSDFPQLDNLRLFSCNKNKIENINIFIEKIRVRFPNLTYLTMLGNLACPNQLVDSSKDDYDYSRYRKYVLHSLRKLRFLDSYEISKAEKEIILKESQFYDVITFTDQSDDQKKQEAHKLKVDKKDPWTPLPSNKKGDSTGDTVPTKGSFGYCKYVYHGKQSEGNRFIRNDDL